MGEPFVELGGESVNYLTEKYWDRLYDTSSAAVKTTKNNVPGASGENAAPPASTVSRSSQRKHKNRLPSPEGSIEAWDRQSYRESNRRDSRRDSSLERESETSEQVLRAYRSERDDPSRKPESVLSRKDLNQLRRDRTMSNANGYYDQQPQQQQGQAQRPRSAGPRSRYYDDDYESDNDDRTGGRRRSSGRGYQDAYEDDDRNYDREVITTERYRGPPRDEGDRRSSRGYANDGYGAGAVAQYQRRGTQDYDAQSRRSRSRSGRGKGRERDRDDSYSRSRSRSRSGDRGLGGLKDKVGEHFDTSLTGLGAGLAGAVVGGMVGRNLGGRNPKHQNRDILIGALVGGLGANAAENKWKDWREDKKERFDRDERYLEDKWDSRDYGRSRSSMR